MAKYNVTYKCGHNDVIVLYGKMAARRETVENLKNENCPTCVKAAREARNAEKNAAAAAANQTAGLPNLTGTDKQAAWAETIRAQVVAELAPILAQSRAKSAEIPQAALATQVIEGWQTQTESSWWIDNRQTNWRTKLAGEIRARM